MSLDTKNAAMDMYRWQTANEAPKSGHLIKASEFYHQVHSNGFAKLNDQCASKTVASIMT